ncbi:hypothetical protein ACK3SF_02695 [Candidatus Nanosalina sp. VS9-1]|uniref:hypothetical protein n=1 Tax=Candidatus Nanosalina sp. VS9-1 TaxID=3388566 RepID=UPI0039DFC02C
MNNRIPEDAESVEEGLSNKVFFHEDRVYKVYRFFPLPGLYASLIELLRGRIVFYSRHRRIRNEVKMTGLIEKAGIRTPEILEVVDNMIVFQKISGKSGFRYLSECGEDEASQFGERIRDFLDELHSLDVALKDVRLSNFIVSNGEVFSIDHEFASLEAGKLFKILDELTVLSSARQTPNYHDFAEGFNPHRYAVYLSVFTAFYHILIFNRSRERLKNLLASLRPRKQS